MIKGHGLYDVAEMQKLSLPTWIVLLKPAYVLKISSAHRQYVPPLELQFSREASRPNMEYKTFLEKATTLFKNQTASI